MINKAKPIKSWHARTGRDVDLVDKRLDIVMRVPMLASASDIRCGPHPTRLGRMAIASMASEICACVSRTGITSAGADASEFV